MVGDMPSLSLVPERLTTGVSPTACPFGGRVQQRPASLQWGTPASRRRHRLRRGLPGYL